MKFKKTFYLIIILILISGCTNNKKNNTEIKILDKAPSTLEDIYKDISKVLDGVGTIERINLDIDFKNEDKSTDKQSGEESSSREESKNPQDLQSGTGNMEKSESQNSSDKESQDSNKSSSSSEDKIDEKIKTSWKDVDKSLESIYLKWSEYESDGIKKGVSKDRVSQLKDSINKMTKSVEERNMIGTYEFGSLSLLNLKPLFNLYKDDYRGEICDLKYSIYQYYIKAISNDKEGALNAVASKEENINKIRLLIGDDEKKTKELEKVSTQLENLDISLNEDSKRVYILEKDTLIKNLESLE